MVSAILLAAGASSRFGSHKLLAVLEGAPLIRHAAERVLSAAVDEVVVVLGRDAGRIEAALEGLALRFVTNRAWAEGLSGSLVEGVRALDPRTRLAVVALGDQPAVDPAVIDALVATAQRERAAITVPVYRGIRGHPIMFSAEVFPELVAVTGDRGARDVIARDPLRAHELAIDADAPRDVDTLEDLEAVRRVASSEWRACHPEERKRRRI